MKDIGVFPSYSPRGSGKQAQHSDALPPAPYQDTFPQDVGLGRGVILTHVGSSQKGRRLKGEGTLPTAAEG